MGYTTDFMGSLKLDKNLTAEQMEYINKFSETRRVKRDTSKLMEMFKGKFGHPTPKGDKAEDIYGNEGEYFVGGKDDYMGANKDASILDYNLPPNQVRVSWGTSGYEKIQKENDRRITEGVCQPGLWCQWVIEQETDENGEEIQKLVWDENEKFYNYVEWLKYLINHFFERWGVKLNGKIKWSGEEPSDVGIIIVKNNEVTTKELDLEGFE